MVQKIFSVIFTEIQYDSRTSQDSSYVAITLFHGINYCIFAYLLILKTLVVLNSLYFYTQP